MTAKKIGTHNGSFHCDEVLACFLLRQLPEYKVKSVHGNYGDISEDPPVSLVDAVKIRVSNLNYSS